MSQILCAIRKEAGFFCFLRKGEVFAYIGPYHNLKDLNGELWKGPGGRMDEEVDGDGAGAEAFLLGLGTEVPSLLLTSSHCPCPFLARSEVSETAPGGVGARRWPGSWGQQVKPRPAPAPPHAHNSSYDTASEIR